MALCCSLAPAAATASVIVDQSTLDTGNAISQVFPDLLNYSTKAFDDFSTSQAYNITALTVFGTEGGTAAANVAVTAEIWSGLPGTGSLVMSSVSVSEVGADLQFNFGGQTLAAGNYWVTAYVTRSFVVGGQWFWNAHSPVSGSEAFLSNPGNGFEFGSAPVRASTVNGGPPVDMAFILAGDPVPEPGSLALVGLAAALGFSASRRRQAPAPA